MPRLETFELAIETGERGMTESPKFSINGFPLDFDRMEGGVGSGETIEALGSPGSFPHSLTLGGPREGAWDIAAIRVTYHPAGEAPYTVRLGAVTLDAESDLDIWHDRPAETLDV
jgi:hypothetical protein